MNEVFIHSKTSTIQKNYWFFKHEEPDFSFFKKILDNQEKFLD